MNIFITIQSVVQNITYTLIPKESNYIVETRTILSKIDTVFASSEKEALEKIKSAKETKLYLKDLKISNDFRGVDFIVLEKE